MQLKMLSILFISILFLAGCGKDGTSSSNVKKPVNLFPNLDRSRLMIPDEWESLQSKSRKLAFGEINPTAEQYIALADGYFKSLSSPGRPHPQYVAFTPGFIVHTSGSLYDMGNQDIACENIKKLKEMGLLYKSIFYNRKGLDVDERILKLIEDCPDNLTENDIARYIVRKPAYFNLVDFESIQMKPPFPKITPDNHKVYVVFTGPKMTDSDIIDLEQAVEAGAEAHAIVTQPDQKAKGVTIHMAKVEPSDLIASNTGLVWFANKKGDVCAFLRPLSGDYSKPIVNYLSKTQE